MRRLWPSSFAYQAMLTDSSRVSHGPRLPQLPRPFWVACAVAALAGCAQQPASRQIATRSTGEYFPSAIYGPASPRVVADGQAVPRGGGQYLVGRPYTVAGRRYYPSESGHESQVGMASYYGAAFHGRKTANGEVFDMASISAAHPTMPLPSYARVTNLSNGRSIIVRVNDRGPYHGGRVLDVSQRAAELLDYRRNGTARVRVDYVGRAPIEGSDDRMLLASLRTDGAPATINGGSVRAAPVMVASAEPEIPQPRPQPPRQTSVVAVVRATPAEEVAVASEPEARQRPTLTAFAPLPPSRPFDLGTIPGAGEPIAAAPPRRAAMFFAPLDQSDGRSTRHVRFPGEGKAAARDER